MTTKWVYNFGCGLAEGDSLMRNLLGGKGANLAEMCNIGLDVPSGFTISTAVCDYYYKDKSQFAFPDDLEKQVEDSLKKIESDIGAKFGDLRNPLLVSVRSGSRASMPGMMDTILNLGLNDETVKALAAKNNNARFAYDSYRRFIQMYSDVVLGIKHHYFEDCLDDLKHDLGVQHDTDLTVDNLKLLISDYKKIVQGDYTRGFPQNVHEQLWKAITAVFDSWMCDRAISYRRIANIPEEWGTAVNVQAMVFGNMGDSSATGVAFTRNPSDGNNELYGEYLINAQGEDVVAGIRTPKPITNASKEAIKSEETSMEEAMPELYKQFRDVSTRLETHYRDMQDIEFTIQEGRLWILQTRVGKRTGKASINIACDFVEEGLISKEEAINRVDPEALNQLLHPALVPQNKKVSIAKGLPASPGAAVGAVVFSVHEAERLSDLGEKVILARTETSPEDINGMYVSQAILTSRGGMTSHAAVVARGMGKPCIVGAKHIHIEARFAKMTIGDLEIAEGDYITIDGSSGEVFLGKLETVQPKISGDFSKMMQWAKEVKKLSVRANAETPEDIKTALNFGAEGIGLCRTEHMFFERDRIVSVRKMIIARNFAEREAALSEILPMQRKDFVKIFELMQGKPVNIRLLDMPLHEFLPQKDEEISDVAKSANVDPKIVQIRCKQLHESNPMLGHRGSRIGITYPEIYEMQVRSILEAMVEVNKSKSFEVDVEIMVPLIATEKEMEILKSMMKSVGRSIESENQIKLKYQIGTMIELPRAALISGKIANHAEFMSYGTNDLSQTTFGISRDDSSTFIPEYVDKSIFTHDPFMRLDLEGVGELIDISSTRARLTNPNIKLGVCGEHAGNPESIAFFNSLNFNYISCSPYRIPTATLAAAQSAIATKCNLHNL